MVATFNVAWDFGGTANTPGTTDTTITNLRFNNEDTNDQDTASPITITPSTTIYSFWKHIYLKCSGAPSLQCNNFKIYTDGSLAWTGCTVKVGDDACTRSHNGGSPLYAGYDPGTASVLTAHDTIATTTSLFTYTSGSARTVTCSESGNLVNATNETTDYVVLQLEVTDTASPGTTATETITFSYDEI